MSRSISWNSYVYFLPLFRTQLRELKEARIKKDWKTADEIRGVLLAFDTGMKINYDPAGKVTLWHYPDPPFEKQFFYANYNEFIANSEETI